MKSLLKSLIACSVLLAAPGAAVAQDGWTSLFDGKTLDGWKHDDVGKAEYKVVDGTIYGRTVEGSPNSFLLSENQYGDFDLTFEVKVHDKLNSGCQVRSRGKTAEDVEEEAKRTGKKNRNNQIGRVHGPQVEIEASPGQAGYVYGEAPGRGWLSPEPQDRDHSHDLMTNGE